MIIIIIVIIIFIIIITTEITIFFSLISLNRLCELPRGFGSFPSLQILDLTYNNLTSISFSANFAYLGGMTLRIMNYTYCIQ